LYTSIILGYEAEAPETVIGIITQVENKSETSITESIVSVLD